MGCGGSKAGGADAEGAPSALTPAPPAGDSAPALPRAGSQGSLHGSEDVPASQRHISVAALPPVPPAIFLAAVFNDVAFFKSLPCVQVALEYAQWNAYKATHPSLTGGTPVAGAASPVSPATSAAAAPGAAANDDEKVTVLQLIMSKTDRHGFNLVQLAAMAGSADVLELFLDALTPKGVGILRHFKTRHGNLLHYGVTGRKAFADVFNAVRMHLLHDPTLAPDAAALKVTSSVGSMDEAFCGGALSGGSGGGGGGGGAFLVPFSHAASQRLLHEPLAEKLRPAIVPGLNAWVEDKEGGEDKFAEKLPGGIAMPASAPLTPRPTLSEEAPAAAGPCGGAPPLSRKASKPNLPRGASTVFKEFKEFPKCTPKEEEEHDPLHIRGIEYMRGLLKYSPTRGPARVPSYPKLAAAASDGRLDGVGAAAAGAAAGGGAASTASAPLAEENSALVVIQEIIAHTRHKEERLAAEAAAGAPSPSPAPTEGSGAALSEGGASSAGSGGGGGGAGLAPIRSGSRDDDFSAKSLRSGVGSFGSFGSADTSAASEEEVFEAHMEQAADHAIIFTMMPGGHHNKKILEALKADSLVGVRDLHIGHGEEGALPYLDARVNLTRAEHQIEDINDIPWLQRFPVRSKARTVQVLLKHFPPGAADGERQGLQAPNLYGKLPLDMAKHSQEQQGEGGEEDPDDVLALVRHDNTHVLSEPPWGWQGRGLLEGIKKGEWDLVVKALEEG